MHANHSNSAGPRPRARGPADSGPRAPGPGPGGPEALRRTPTTPGVDQRTPGSQRDNTATDGPALASPAGPRGRPAPQRVSSATNLTARSAPSQACVTTYAVPEGSVPASSALEDAAAPMALHCAS